MTLRPYRDDTDLERLLAISRSAVAVDPRPVLYHPGDIIWQRYGQTEDIFRQSEQVLLWEEQDGSTPAFVWISRDGALIQPEPEWLARPGGIDGLIAALIDLFRDQGKTSIETEVFPGQAPLIAALARAGFAHGETAAYVRFEQPLTDRLPAPVLPDAWRIEPVTRDSMLGQRIALHREVWYPSRITVEAYKRLRAHPLYDPELDLVAVHESGDFGAYCICWFDPPTRTALFEPVGAANPFRRLGLARAVLHDGLRRLRDRGATVAHVNTGEVDNPPKFVAAASQALYVSAGFQLVDRSGLWTKSL